MALRVDDLKGEPVSRGELDFLQRHFDDQIIDPIIVPNHEIPLLKRLVPANLAEQILDRNHQASFTGLTQYAEAFVGHAFQAACARLAPASVLIGDTLKLM